MSMTKEFEQTLTNKGRELVNEGNKIINSSEIKPEDKIQQLAILDMKLENLQEFKRK